MLTDCLAATGSDAPPLILAAAFLLLMGAAVVAIARRRGRHGASAATIVAILLAGGLVVGGAAFPAPAYANAGCSSAGEAPIVATTPTGSPTPSVEPVATSTPTAAPTVPPTPTPTETPEPVANDGIYWNLNVKHVPEGVYAVTTRIWDGYNNCVEATDPTDDYRAWEPDVATPQSISAKIYWEYRSSGSCIDEASRLHWSVKLYLGETLLDEYLVNATKQRVLFASDGSIGCYGPFNSATAEGLPHATCTSGESSTVNWAQLSPRVVLDFAPGTPESPSPPDLGAQPALTTMYFHVSGGPEGSYPSGTFVRSARLWDDDNRCVEESSPLSDARLWTVSPTATDRTIIGQHGLTETDCPFTQIKLHWRLDFYVDGVRVDSYTVRSYSTGTFISRGFRSVCDGPVDRPAVTPGNWHVRCNTAGYEVDQGGPDDWQDFAFYRS